MTPTPEMEDFARDVAMRHFGTCNGLMVRIMSAAIMEMSEKVARDLDGNFTDNRGYAERIRNGEHFR